MTAKHPPINIRYLVLRYVNGESEKALAESLGVSRYLVRRWLTEVGVQMRGRSEAMYTRMTHTTRKERAKLTKAAHDAVRGTTQSDTLLEARARGREGTIDSRVSPAELRLGEMLRTEGYVVVHQKAVGKYSVDLATGTVAVEVLGGAWHQTKRHRERLRYLLNRGWDVIFIWVNEVDFPLGPGAAQYVITHLQFRDRNPAEPRCYRVIRGNDQLIAGGSADDDDVPDVLPYSDLPDVAPTEVPFGFCHCGCGRKTTIAAQSHTARGLTKGQPMRYISGHNRARNPR